MVNIHDQHSPHPSFWKRCFHTIIHKIIQTRCLGCDAPLGRVRNDTSAHARLCATCQTRLAPRVFGFCPVCGQLEPEEHLSPIRRCPICREQPPACAKLFFYGCYDDLIRDHILRFKFSGDLSSGRLLGQLMTTAWLSRHNDETPDLLVPIPLHDTRLRFRGFNQSVELCRYIRSPLGLPFSSSALLRIRNTTPQSRLAAPQRHTNLLGAFRADSSQISGKIILLIDDVATTNSTLNEAARTLIEAGALRVLALVAAKAK